MVVAGFSLEGGQLKKPGLAQTVSGFVAAGTQKATVAFRVIIWENQHLPVIGKTEYYPLTTEYELWSRPTR